MSTLTDNAIEAQWFGPDDPLATRVRAAESRAAMQSIAEDLKPPSRVVAQVLALCSSESSTVGDIREVIESEPVLAAQLLRVANSAAMATRTECRSIDDAVIRLGVRRVRGVAAGLAALGSFERETDHTQSIRLHSARVAQIVEIIGREWRLSYAGDLFLIGLVHDIGELALPGEIRDASGHSTQLEEERFGFDHAALGAVILRKWSFPPDLVEIVGLHHDAAHAYEAGGATAVSVALLRLAEHIDEALEEGGTAWEALAASGECSFLNITAEHLEAARPRLEEAREGAGALLR